MGSERSSTQSRAVPTAGISLARMAGLNTDSIRFAAVRRSQGPVGETTSRMTSGTLYKPI